MKGFILICGIDAQGNLAIANKLKETYSNYISLAKDTPDLKAEWSDVLAILYNATLEDINADRPDLPKTMKHEGNNLPVYWFIRDVQADKAKTEFTSTWNTPKALRYFRERYREAAGHYGVPLVESGKWRVDEEAGEIVRVVESGEYGEVVAAAARTLTPEFVKERDVEAFVYNELSEECVKTFPEVKLLFKDEAIDRKLADAAKEDLSFKRRLVARWLVNSSLPVAADNLITYKKDNISIAIKQGLYFKLYTENETHKTYTLISQSSYINSLMVVLPKCAEAKSSSQELRVFIEMMWRNKLKHAYRSINDFGIAVANSTKPNPVKVTVKKYFEGQPFYGIDGDESVVLSTGEYTSGPHVSFTWISPPYTSFKAKDLSVYYYLLKEHLGSGKCMANAADSADTAISAEIIEGAIDVESTREAAMKAYCTFQAYMGKANLEARRVSFFLDPAGQSFCSPINQEFIKIQSKETKEVIAYDLVNKTLINYFGKHKYADTEMQEYNHYKYEAEVERILADKRLKLSTLQNGILQKMRYLNLKRSVIFTLEIHGKKPSLAKSGKRTTHSNGDIDEALKYITIYPDIMVVDVEGSNREIVKSIGKRHYAFASGGIAALEDAQEVLDSGVRKVVVGCSAEELVKMIPKDRLIVELILDKHNCLAPSKERVEEAMRRLLQLGVKEIRVTFEGQAEGIPREQIKDLVSQTPAAIEKIIVGGEISKLEDLEFLWSFNRVVPQVGSAIWTSKTLLSDIYVAMTRFDGNGLVTGVIQDVHGIVKGLFWLNAQALRRTCDTRLLHRYSRAHKKLMCKGESSGCYHPVKQISLDCDSDSLLVTVESEKGFCHLGMFSCYEVQTPVKTNLGDLAEHVGKSKGVQSYSGKMQRNPGLTLAKLMEEYWEIICADKDSKMLECADLLVHYLMYLNSMDISLDDVQNELHTRRHNPRIVATRTSKHRKFPGHVVVGVAASSAVALFAAQWLGLEVTKSGLFKVEYKVVDKEKYEKCFGSKEVLLLPMKVEDMAMLTSIVDFVIAHDIDIRNGPLEYAARVEAADKQLRLVLLKRQTEEVDVSKWSKKYKAVVASQFPREVTECLRKRADEDAFTLVKTSGLNESYLLNASKTNFLLCDKILAEGEKVNDLDVWEVVKDYGEVKIGLYEVVIK